MSSHAISPARIVTTGSPVARQLHLLAARDVRFGEDRLPAPDQPWWRAVAATGTRSWLDTGDIGEADRLWCASFSALTTNNTLLNKEVQKGQYDDLVKEAVALVKGLPPAEQVIVDFANFLFC